MRSKSKRQPTNAEKVAPIFCRCDCGGEGGDATRERFVYVWNGDDGIRALVGPLCCASIDEVRARIAAGPREGRPSALIRIKPHPELIAMADRIGEPVQ